MLLLGPYIDLAFGSVQENDPSGRHFPAHRQLPDLHKGSSITVSSFSLKMGTPMLADMSRNIHLLTRSPTLNNLQHFLSAMFIYFVADWRCVNVTPQDGRCILVNCFWQCHWGQGRTEETTHISRSYHLKYQFAPLASCAYLFTGKKFNTALHVGNFDHHH